MTKLFTRLIKNKEKECRSCLLPSDDGCYGQTYPVHKRGGYVELHVFSLCRICFDMELAISEAGVYGRRFTSIGVGTDEIGSEYGRRCVCGCVTHATLGMCIQCSKDNRMLTAMQAQKKFTDRLLKELKAQIKSTLKENQNAN